MANYSGQEIASTENEIGVFDVRTAEYIYSTVVGGAPLPSIEQRELDLDHLTIEHYRLEETLPPFDWWRCLDPDTGEEYLETDFDDLALANLDTLVYAKAYKLAGQQGKGTQFPARLRDGGADGIGDDHWFYVKNRDPNSFAMKGDIIQCVEVEDEIYMVGGGRNSIDGITFNTSRKSDDILQSPTDCFHSEVRLIGAPGPNVPRVVSAWTEAVPNLYETMNVDEYLYCRIARSSGLWVYESLGCVKLGDQGLSPDEDIYGTFDGRARYDELYTAGYYSERMLDQGT